MRDSYKLFIVVFLSALSALSLTSAGLVYWQDPIGYFRPNPEGYSRANSLYLNATIPLQHEYDSLLIGSSMIQNYRLSELKSSLGGEFLALTTSPASPLHQAWLVERVLKKRKIKKIVWALDIFPSIVEHGRSQNPYGELPAFLYGDLWHKWEVISGYLLSHDFLQHSYELARGEKRRPLDELYDWSYKHQFNCERVVAYLEHVELHDMPNLKKINTQVQLEGAEKWRDVFDPLFSLAKRYPDIQFLFFFPPYSVAEIYYRNIHLPSFSQMQLTLKQQIYNLQTNLAHVRVWDFQDDQTFVGALNEYKDSHHHSRAWDHRVIKSLADESQSLPKETKALQDRFDRYSTFHTGMTLKPKCTTN
jgi:hypothetical protein